MGNRATSPLCRQHAAADGQWRLAFPLARATAGNKMSTIKIALASGRGEGKGTEEGPPARAGGDPCQKVSQRAGPGMPGNWGAMGGPDSLSLIAGADC